MPATDIKFVLRIPVEIFGKLKGVKQGSGESINQQIVRRLRDEGEREGGDVQDGMSGGGVRGGAGKLGKGRDIKGLGSTSGGEASGDGGAVVGGGKEDRRKHKKAEREAEGGRMSREKYSGLSKSEQMRAMREGTAPKGF
jgi:Arc-like DNA binding domain